MLELLQKAYRLLRNRPLEFVETLGQYFRFQRTRALYQLFPPEKRNVRLGQNVRVQAFRCLAAELPNASVLVGEDSIIYEFAEVRAYGIGQLTIGQGCIIGDARIYSRNKIMIGSRVVTSWNVFIQDFDPHPVEAELRAIQMKHMCLNFRPCYKRTGTKEALPALNWKFPTDAIVIGDDVWIGANVTILKGAQIGDGCTVATGAVVIAGQYPPRSIIGGVPAKILKTL